MQFLRRKILTDLLCTQDRKKKMEPSIRLYGRFPTGKKKVTNQQNSENDSTIDEILFYFHKEMGHSSKIACI